MTRQQLIEKRATLFKKAENFLHEHTDADGKISVEDAATCDRMLDEVEAFGAQIKRTERVTNMNNYLSQPQPLPLGILTNPNYFGDEFGGCQKAGVAGKEYHRNFLNQFRTNFKTAQNFLREASLPDGGYLLPVEMHNEIVSALEQDNVLRQIGKTITTASEHKISIVATKPAASWVAEGADISFSNETFGSINLSAHKLAVAIKVSNELLQDSFYDLEAHLISEFATAFATAEEDAFINGDGDNKPKGILPTLAASPSTTIKTAGTEITVDDLLNLSYSLKRPYRHRACWLMSDSTLALIRKIKDATQNYIWQPSLTETEPSRLFGQPVYSSPFMPAASSGNVCVLYGDFADYFVIGERGQREVRPLRELYAMSGQTAFLMTERIDSALTNLEAVKGLQLK